MSGSFLEKFITSCTLTFKAFDHEVNLSRNKANLWHFTSFSTNTQKKYMVYCAPDLSKVSSLITVASKKVPKGSRLVVVCKEVTPEQLKLAEENGYTLVTHSELKDYGTKMLEAKANQAS